MGLREAEKNQPVKGGKKGKIIMGKKHKKRKSINERREGEFVSMVNSIEREGGRRWR